MTERLKYNLQTALIGITAVIATPLVMGLGVPTIWNIPLIGISVGTLLTAGGIALIGSRIFNKL